MSLIDKGYIKWEWKDDKDYNLYDIKDTSLSHTENPFHGYRTVKWSDGQIENTSIRCDSYYKTFEELSKGWPTKTKFTTIKSNERKRSTTEKKNETSITNEEFFDLILK